MDVRQLRCFIAVAETLHFGRAAQRLDMLPASFGRHIKQLEQSLGCRLLDRTTRHVSLTPAGQTLAGEAREIIDRIDRLETLFRDGAAQTTQTLRIGAIDSAAAGLMPLILSRFREASPDTDVELLEQKSLHLIPRVLSGRLDAAIVRPPAVPDPRLAVRPLFAETAVVAVPAGHPLAARKTLSVHDMAGEAMIVPDRRSRPHSHDLTITLFQDAGLTAHIAQIAEEKQTIVSLVATGVGLAIVPRWAARLAVDGVTFLPLRTDDSHARSTLKLAVVWLRNTRHPARDAFLKVLDDNVDTLAKIA